MVISGANKHSALNSHEDVLIPRSYILYSGKGGAAGDVV